MPSSRKDNRRIEHLAPDQHTRIMDIPNELRGIWATTRLEHDRQLLALSSSGIGILVSISLALKPTNLMIICFLTVSIAMFASCVVLLLIILRSSADFLEAEAKDDQKTSEKIIKQLRKLDALTLWLFTIGVLSTGFSGLIALFI